MTPTHYAVVAMVLAALFLAFAIIIMVPVVGFHIEASSFY